MQQTIKAPFIKQGWLRAFLYIIIMFLGIIGFQFIAGKIIALLPNDKTAETSIRNFVILYLTITLGVVLVTWLCRKFVDRETLKSLGFQWKGFTNEAWMGFFTGPALLGIGTIILAVAGYLTFIGIGVDLPFILLELAILVVVAFSEELLFRGYLLNNLMQSMNRWIALAVSSVLFAIFHGANPGVTVLALANIFAAGFLLGINYIYTRNLWFGILFHFSWNFFQGPVLGYQVSGLNLKSVLEQSIDGPAILTGEPFGFEGSILCPLLIVLACIYFAYVFSLKYKQAKVA